MTILPHSPRFDSPHACHVAEEQAFLAKAFHVACYAIVLLVLALAALWLFALATSTAHGQTPPPAASVSVATADGPVALAPLPPEGQAALALAEKLHPGWPWGQWLTEFGAAWAIVIGASKVFVKVCPAPVVPRYWCRTPLDSQPISLRFVETNIYEILHYIILHFGALATPVAPPPAAPDIMSANRPPPTIPQP